MNSLLDFAGKPPDFFKITDDHKLSEILDERWSELIRCLGNKAHFAGIILMGSILEGVLLAIAYRFPEQAKKAPSAPKDKSNRTRSFDKWTLNDLIEVASECGWIHQDAKKFSHLLRRYRNLIHPWEQKQSTELPDEDSCRQCWEIVHKAIYELEGM